eukprot:scaffold73368_cov33-Phaeocystis_antarctica.AAC.1
MNNSSAPRTAPRASARRHSRTARRARALVAASASRCRRFCGMSGVKVRVEVGVRVRARARARARARVRDGAKVRA